METWHPGPRASIGQHVSTTPPRTPTSQSCRFTVGSQCEGASCTVDIMGKVMGDMEVGPGCTVRIMGKVMGDVLLRGSDLVLTGVVMGDIDSDRGRVEILGKHLGELW